MPTDQPSRQMHEIYLRSRRIERESENRRLAKLKDRLRVIAKPKELSSNALLNEIAEQLRQSQQVVKSH
jgi:hypothetical protein